MRYQKDAKAFYISYYSYLPTFAGRYQMKKSTEPLKIWMLQIFHDSWLNKQWLHCRKWQFLMVLMSPPCYFFIKLLFYKALRKTNRWSKFNIKKPSLKKVSIQWLNIQENLKDNFSVWNWLLLLFLFLFVNIRFSRRVAARGYCTGSVTLGCTKI